MTDRALDTSAASSGLRQRLSGVPVLVWIALTWLIAMVAVALLADLVSPYSYTAPNLRNRLVAPAIRCTGSAPTSLAATCSPA